MAEQLLVVGSGTMGTQIALQAALSGVAVHLVDIDAGALSRARTDIDGLLARRVKSARLEESDVEAVRSRLAPSADLDAAAGESDWVIEAVVERVDVKRQVFGQLDAALPAHAGIATNSSAIVSSRLADATGRPDRCLNMHFFHPVLVMDLCEIVAGPHTSPSTTADAVAWARRIGRTPVVLTAEVDGFVVNRILGGASREAFGLVAAGVASPADVDVAVRQGLRWPLGPFELADLSGLDVLLEIRRDRHAREGDQKDLLSAEVLQRLVDAGRLGRKSGAGFYDYSTDPPTPLPLPDPA